MDPISAALIAAITAGIAGGLPKVAEKAITDAYEALKARLKGKAGERSDVVQAVERLESDPESTAWKAVLQEQMARTKLAEDAELTQAAERLRKLMEAQPGLAQHIRTVTASGERSIAIGGNVQGSRVSAGDQTK